MDFKNEIWFYVVSCVLGFVFSASFWILIGDSTDQEFELSADMMVHDMDDETTLEEEELLEGKEEEEINDELEELQKVSICFKIVLKTKSIVTLCAVS